MSSACTPRAIRSPAWSKDHLLKRWSRDHRLKTTIDLKIILILACLTLDLSNSCRLSRPWRI